MRSSAFSSSDPACIHHRHSRGKLRSLNPSRLNGSSARMRIGVSAVAEVSLSRALLWVRLSHTADIRNRANALPTGVVGLRRTPGDRARQPANGCANRTTHQPTCECTRYGPGREALLRGCEARRGERQAKRDSCNLRHKILCRRSGPN